MANKKYILTKETAGKKLRRMALEVVEQNYGEQQLVLVGIKDNGLIIAHKISDYLKEVFTGEIIVAALTMDKKNPFTISVEPAMDFNDKIILLIDDVANSGKAMLYALKPFLETHPKKIQTLALVERTHKSFPIDLDYVGLSFSTTLDEHIYVEVEGTDVVGAWMEAP
ncbi:phosphoribosyltransferase family protein [Ferruginibacter paludis]|uniref:phosphoribosyltransferase family protein n=1 Tax=Ferruginibacter TaxID=1004303 RepID=UPI0025B3F91F|nr:MULTISPECIES: phosphoribosyltransferase family protein [Ferruginibacter]MDB5277187.1 phosphoribosyltransferase [Ferruginibacter sp.]MDN3656416.1 phosphoribosyltransferase family protein [Ferruginibacter paludis]